MLDSVMRNTDLASHGSVFHKTLPDEPIYDPAHTIVIQTKLVGKTPHAYHLQLVVAYMLMDRMQDCQPFFLAFLYLII